MADLGLKKLEEGRETPIIKPLSEKVWSFDPSVDLNEDKPTTNEQEMIHKSIVEKGSVFAPEDTAAYVEDISTRGTNPFSGVTDVHNALREERDFDKEVVLPGMEALGKKSVELAGKDVYTPSFGDILPLLAVALFSDDDAFNKGFLEASKDKKIAKHKAGYAREVAMLQDEAQMLQTKAKFLAKNTSYYKETLAYDNQMFSVLNDKIKYKKAQWEISQTPVILQVVSENIKEQVDALKLNKFANVKTNDEVLSQIMNSMSDKGASLTQIHKDTLLEVYNTVYIRQMESAGIMTSYAKGTLDPTAKDADKTNKTQTQLFKVASIDTGVQQQSKSIEKDIGEKHALGLGGDTAKNIISAVDGINTILNKHNTANGLEGDAKITLDKILGMTDEQINSIPNINKFNRAENNNLVNMMAVGDIHSNNLINLKKELDLTIQGITPVVAELVEFHKNNIDESKNLLIKTFSGLAGYNEDYAKETAEVNKYFNVDIVEIAANTALKLTADYASTNTAVAEVGVLANPEFWDIMKNVEQNVRTKDAIKNKDTEITFSEYARRLSKDSTATDKQKMEAIEYFAKSIKTYDNLLQMKYFKEEDGKTEKRMPLSEGFQFMYSSRESSTRSKEGEGFLYGVPISEIQKAQNKFFTSYNIATSSAGDLNSILQPLVGVNSEVADFITDRIVESMYSKDPNSFLVRYALKKKR